MDLTIIYQSLAAVFCLSLVFVAGYMVCNRRSVRKFQAQCDYDRQEMLTIERALKQFWDHEREKLENEKKELERRIQIQEERLDLYRRKAAGIGMMGLRKSKMTDMLISLLIENETLEEKLFLQNIKLKEERDEFLKNEMRHISYKRILLSELINQDDVRRQLERAINERGTWRRLDMKGKDLSLLLPDKPDEEDGH